MNLSALLGSNWSQGSTVNTNSGTAVALSTTIPANAKVVDILFNGVSTNGSNNLKLQLGSGSYTTTGYAGVTSMPAGNGSNETTGVLLQSSGGDPSRLWTGWARIVSLGNNSYFVYGFMAPANYNSFTSQFAYSVTLGGVLDRVQLTTTTGSDTFDAGTTSVIHFS